MAEQNAKLQLPIMPDDQTKAPAEQSELSGEVQRDLDKLSEQVGIAALRIPKENADDEKYVALRNKIVTIRKFIAQAQEKNVLPSLKSGTTEIENQDDIAAEVRNAVNVWERYNAKLGSGDVFEESRNSLLQIMRENIAATNMDEEERESNLDNMDALEMKLHEYNQLSKELRSFIDTFPEQPAEPIIGKGMKRAKDIITRYDYEIFRQERGMIRQGIDNTSIQKLLTYTNSAMTKLVEMRSKLIGDEENSPAWLERIPQDSPLPNLKNFSEKKITEWRSRMEGLVLTEEQLDRVNESLERISSDDSADLKELNAVETMIASHEKDQAEDQAMNRRLAEITQMFVHKEDPRKIVVLLEHEQSKFEQRKGIINAGTDDLFDLMKNAYTLAGDDKGIEAVQRMRIDYEQSESIEEKFKDFSH